MKDRIETYANEKRNYGSICMIREQQCYCTIHAGLRKDVVFQPRNDADRTTVARHDCLTSVQGQSGSFQPTAVSK